jgi:GNAT superfamily N-acetyltransferase
MQFSHLELSKRLERAELEACVQYAAARRRLVPESGAEWIECGGGYAVFDGAESPATQTFGLGLFEPLTAQTLDAVEAFFRERSAPVQHEVSPFVGTDALQLLCERGYQPIELTSVLYREIKDAESKAQSSGDEVSVRVIGESEADLWADVSARGWSSEYPELAETMRDFGRLCVAREDSIAFLAELNGEAGAAAVLCIHGMVALLGGAATLKEMRRHGLQSALMQARLEYASAHGCDLAMMGALPGSESQRNAERWGFRIAYTRTKWGLKS